MYLLGFSTFWTFLLTNFIIENLWIYIISFIMVTISTNMLESNASNLFAKVVPHDYEVGIFNAGIKNLNLGFIITISTTVGRTIGSNFLTISGLISVEYINSITYSFCTFFFLILFFLGYFFYGELRVKAIARIIKKKSFKKMKKDDF